MISKTLSASIHGVDVFTVEVEINNRRSENRPDQEYMLSIIGLPDASIRESRDRIWSALSQCSVRMPEGRTTINLAPADLRKSGSCFDLAIALCLIASSRGFKAEELRNTMIIGELGLTGEVRAVPGALPIAMHARSIGVTRMLVPQENASEAAAVSGLTVYGVRHLLEAVVFFREHRGLLPTTVDVQALLERNQQNTLDFLDVKGQESAKRALLIAAAGNHNLLMIGEPGVGKSLIANRIPGILPPLTLQEALEVTKIHSIAGTLDPRIGLIASRPFRSPHHTVSDAGLLGGGKNIPRPGEISLAHRGVLFLDELPEYRRNVLESLRQPLESGEVTLARAAGSFTFPAKIMLVAAMNPCPCGYYGSHSKRCTCTTMQIINYRARISGPLLDRIDLHIDVPPVSQEVLTGKRSGECSASMRAKVLHVRERQLKRFGNTGIMDNSSMTGKYLDEFCPLNRECLSFLRQAITQLNINPRSYDRILRIARTIADLEQSQDIAPQHLSEAINYRSLDRSRQQYQ
ncbi:MAG: YifB family Mg chelatase-like AAA ATPase [Lentisphaerae bacterium]|nr:YifB family Mg chelatase-like AAA ATPase [Lentisphaerota bacterium]